MSQPATNMEATQLSQTLLQQLSPQTAVRIREPLAKRTTLRVGGPADLYIEPASETDLAATLQFCAEHHLPFFVLGRGSNLLVRDGGFRGAVICLGNPAFARLEVAGEQMRCGAGARLKSVAVEARRHSLGGLEFLEGIPGSVGGGLRMNAGAMGGSMFDVVVSVRSMDHSGRILERLSSQMAVAYRSCATLVSEIALEALLRGKTEPRETIERRMNEFSHKRWESQPAASSAGCMFKNPASIPAGKLIDELGLKGTRVGGARVSLEHGNFLINDGSATARDVLELIELVRARALRERGIQLRTEVEIIGEDGADA
ncbi:MAG TPA: UDP-N-acetylmuramate dehydrogenase [Verrucomicrobiae bacterium]|nr:UDP-N-acetylmuramate dehydrogenase [Verrucomicrobiae bacterium]